MSHPPRQATNVQGRRVLYDELKVEPTVVIVMLAKVYVNVAGVGRDAGINDVFLQAVVRDGRSFDLQIFKDAPRLVNEHYNGTATSTSFWPIFHAVSSSAPPNTRRAMRSTKPSR